jgi:hypothetical protein
MNMYAILVPSFVSVTALEKRKAVKMSHTVGSAKPDRTTAGGSVLVSARAVMESKIQAPIAIG